jgi:hypothetical protein
VYAFNRELANMFHIVGTCEPSLALFFPIQIMCYHPAYLNYILSNAYLFRTSGAFLYTLYVIAFIHDYLSGSVSAICANLIPFIEIATLAEIQQEERLTQ